MCMIELFMLNVTNLSSGECEMKKLILTVAIIGSMFSLTACGEKKDEAKQTEIQAPVASPVQSVQNVQASNTVSDAEKMMLTVMKDEDEELKYFDETSVAKYYVSNKTRQHGEYRFVQVARKVKVNNKEKDELKGDDILYGADFDCQNKRYRSIYKVLVRNGKHSFFTENVAEWSPYMTPDSVGGKMISEVCSR